MRGLAVLNAPRFSARPLLAQALAFVLTTAFADARPARAETEFGPNGLVVESADKKHRFEFHGLVHADARLFLRDRRDATNTFVLRRARPTFDARLFRWFEFRVMPGFGNGNASLYDAYIDAEARPEIRVRAGKFKGPVGLERLQNAQALYFTERALPTDLVPNRDVGAMVHGKLWGGVLGYELGVFNGTADGQSVDADVDDAKELAGRLYTSPWASTPGSLLHGALLGLGFTRGRKRGTESSPYVAAYGTMGQNDFFAYRDDDGGTVHAAGLHARLSPQLYMPIGPVAVLAEYVVSQQRVALGNASRLLVHHAWAVTVAWSVTGERAHYDGVDPIRELDVARGHWGALELVARCGGLEVDRDAFPALADPGDAARSASEFAAGVNWHANHTIRLSTDYVATRFRGGATPTEGADRPTEHTLLLRGQFLF